MVSSSHERTYKWQEDTADNSRVLNAYVKSYYAEVLLEKKTPKRCSLSLKNHKGMIISLPHLVNIDSHFPLLRFHLSPFFPQELKRKGIMD